MLMVEELMTADYFSLFRDFTHPVDMLTGMHPEIVIQAPDRQASGKTDVMDFLSEMQLWLKRYNWDIIRHRKWEEDPGGIASEYTLLLDYQGKVVSLPVLVIIRMEEGLMKDISIYHSHWPLSGKHEQRIPFLEPTEREIPNAISGYKAALASGDAGKVLETLDDDAIIREPSGTIHHGKNQLRNFYGGFFEIGGLPLQICRKTEGEGVIAIEFTIEQIGEIKLRPQAGAAVYEFDRHSQKITGIRIYDDFDPSIKA